MRGVEGQRRCEEGQGGGYGEKAFTRLKFESASALYMAGAPALAVGEERRLVPWRGTLSRPFSGGAERGEPGL